MNLFDLKILNVKIEINGSTCEDAVNLVRTSGVIEKILVDNSQSDGVDLDFSNLKIKYAKIRNSQGDCLDLSQGSYSVEFAILSDCKDKAVSAGEISNLFINHIDIQKSFYGLVAKDYSEVKVNKVKIQQTNNCLSVYSKKQEFSGASVLINNFHCQSSNSNIDSDAISIIKIDEVIWHIE